ncbi:MAG: UbiH/UbiF/VisC/COQ6 family ubiquinone biosynthesis hydroxylase [Alphaproteobacteria bacterium]
MDKFDTIIVGGGPVGGSLAIALAKAGLQVAVVERVNEIPKGSEGRALAISHGSHNVFRGIDLWQHVEDHAQPIHDIRVTDGDAPWYIHYDPESIGNHPLGYMIEFQFLAPKIMEVAQQQKNIKWLAPEEVTSFNRDGNGAEVHLASGKTIVAPLLVAADGRFSKIRESVGFKVTRWQYGQKALVCVVEHEKSHNGQAFEGFLPEGPFAMLPMKGNRSSIVWMEEASAIDRYLEYDDQALAAEIQRRFGDDYGTLKVVSKRWSYPLGVHFAHEYIDNRLALVGDAAHSIHPVAGQGLNLGIRDMAALAEIIVETHRMGLDIGGHTALERYQRWRRFDNMTMMAVTHGLVKFFGLQSAPVRLVRGLGFRAINALRPVKRHFMQHAMGVSGELPKLVAGEGL